MTDHKTLSSALEALKDAKIAHSMSHEPFCDSSAWRDDFQDKMRQAITDLQAMLEREMLTTQTDESMRLLYATQPKPEDSPPVTSEGFSYIGGWPGAVEAQTRAGALLAAGVPVDNMGNPVPRAKPDDDLLGVLRFYADPNNYRFPLNHKGEIIDDTPIENDRGEQAREAIHRAETQKE